MARMESGDPTAVVDLGFGDTCSSFCLLCRSLHSPHLSRAVLCMSGAELLCVEGFTMPLVYFKTVTSGAFMLPPTSDGRIDFSALAAEFGFNPKYIKLNNIRFYQEGKSDQTWEQMKAYLIEGGSSVAVGTKEDPVVVTGEPTGFTMQVVYFRTDLSLPVGFCTSDGRIDFSALGQEFKLDQSSIRLNEIMFSHEGLQSRDTWTTINNIFRQKGLPVGTEENAVVVTGEAPVPTAGQATSEQDDRFEKMLEELVKLREGVEGLLQEGFVKLTESVEGEARKKSKRISEANSTVMKEVQSAGGCGDILTGSVLFNATNHKARDIPAFKWGDRVESAQAPDYVKYIEEYLVQLNQKWSVINGNHHPDLLDGNLGENGEGPVFKGTTDVAVVKKDAEDIPETGLKIIFKLKKVGKIDETAEYQTIVSVLLANSFCLRLRPVGMLSDLVDVWKFFWIEDSSTVYRHSFPSRSEAVGFLDAFLKGDSELEDDNHDTSALRRLGELSSRGVKRNFQGSNKFSTPKLERLEELTVCFLRMNFGSVVRQFH